MHKSHELRFVIPLAVVAVFAFAAPASGGGWSVLTLDELPGRVVASQPVTIGFVVRQHGQRPLGGLNGTVVFDQAGETQLLRFPIYESGATGHYTATITLPTAGAWRWRIDAFSEHVMPPLIVQAAAPRSQSTAVQATKLTSTQTIALGKDLFVAKGCSACHGYQTIPLSGRFSGAYGAGGAPNLTVSKFDAAYLRAWLKDPKAVKPNTVMPDLNLKPAEIEALTAFLTQKVHSEQK